MPISYSRAQMEQIIKSGGSVILDGRSIERVEDLPPESELAANDRQRARAVLNAHDEQIAKLTAERAKLQAIVDEKPAPPPPAETPPPARAGDQPDQPDQPPPGRPPPA